MDAIDHTIALGRLVSVLQILETTLRLAMEQLEPNLAAHWHWGALQVGQAVPYDALADYRGLRTTIERYNGLVPAPNRIDAERLVALRDALAHGRVFPMGDTGFPMRLVKFGPSAGTTFPVEQVADMTQEWLQEQISLVGAAIQRLEGRPR